MASLSPEHRGVLLEVFYGGLTTSEAARVLKIPSGTAKSRLYYALRHMRAAVHASGAGAAVAEELLGYFEMAAESMRNRF